MKLPAVIERAAAEAFFPEPLIKAPVRRKLLTIFHSTHGGTFVGEASALLRSSGYEGGTALRGSLRDVAGEGRLTLFAKTVRSLQSNFQWWLSGLDEDALSAYPAQELVCVCPDLPEPFDWKERWASLGGRVVNGRLVALKWDDIWTKASVFELPWSPFQLGSGYDVEDIDEEEARSLGFKIPKAFKVTIDTSWSIETLRSRFSAALDDKITRPPLLVKPPVLKPPLLKPY